MLAQPAGSFLEARGGECLDHYSAPMKQPTRDSLPERRAVRRHTRPRHAEMNPAAKRENQPRPPALAAGEATETHCSRPWWSPARTPDTDRFRESADLMPPTRRHSHQTTPGQRLKDATEPCK